MANLVHRTQSCSALRSLPAEIIDDATDVKYPPYVGVLIATGASALLWSIIGSLVAALV